MSYRPLISVVIPTFNRARQVQAALLSVLAQTYREFEAIVIDDGSTDETGRAIQEVIRSQENGEEQIRYFFQPNQGQSAARNKGTDEARGEWVAFLDSDDVWLPEKLEWQVRAIERFKDKCCACITDARLVDNLGTETTAFRESGKHYETIIGMDSQAVKRLAKSFDHFWTSSLLARVDVIRQVGRFDPTLIFNEDNDLFFRLSLATSYCYVNRPLLVIDRSCSPLGSKCRPWDQVEIRLRGRQSMLEKWLTLDLKLTPDVRKTVLQSLQQVYSAWTNWYLEHEQYEEARRAVGKAIECELTTKLVLKWALTHVAPSFARRISPKMKVYR
jgi:glycosyltransferase involved in cell wall biosynthesis